MMSYQNDLAQQRQQQSLYSMVTPNHQQPVYNQYNVTTMAYNDNQNNGEQHNVNAIPTDENTGGMYPKPVHMQEIIHHRPDLLPFPSSPRSQSPSASSPGRLIALTPQPPPPLPMGGSADRLSPYPPPTLMFAEEVITTGGPACERWTRYPGQRSMLPTDGPERLNVVEDDDDDRDDYDDRSRSSSIGNGCPASADARRHEGGGSGGRRYQAMGNVCVEELPQHHPIYQMMTDFKTEMAPTDHARFSNNL